MIFKTTCSFTNILFRSMLPQEKTTSHCLCAFLNFRRRMPERLETSQRTMFVFPRLKRDLARSICRLPHCRCTINHAKPRERDHPTWTSRVAGGSELPHRQALLSGWCSPPRQISVHNFCLHDGEKTAKWCAFIPNLPM